MQSALSGAPKARERGSSRRRRPELHELWTGCNNRVLLAPAPDEMVEARMTGPAQSRQLPPSSIGIPRLLVSTDSGSEMVIPSRLITV